MTNAKKINLIRGYLSQENCAGVEFTRMKGGKEVKSGVRASIDLMLMSPVEIIGDPKPIAIELEPLEVGDQVWAGGELGEILSIEYRDSRPYTVKINGDKRTYWERHRLIKVEE